MALLGNRRLLVSVGGGVVVVLLALGGALFIKSRDHAPATPPPASTGGLIVQTGPAEDTKLDPAKPLRCFVAGQFIGLETLSACAEKNGVATQALDVGVDQTGALAAAGGPTGTAVTPLPPASSGEITDESTVDSAAQPVTAPQSHGPAGDCLRYAGAWRKAGSNLPLSACIQLLYGGRCAKPGEAVYGRWMDQTLRLVPHKVEMSADNRNFRTVVEQIDDTCVIPQF